MRAGLDAVLKWFGDTGRTPFPFQREAWEAYARGQSGMIQAPTGMGKTLAAFLGLAIEWLDAPPKVKRNEKVPLRLIWLTPLRALASDTVESLSKAIAGLGLPWTVELRTSDTSAAVRRRQKERLPTVLVTTPESLSLLLSYEDARERLSTVRCVVVDEWHELLGTKRGIQAELALARLRTFNSAVRTWGISATLDNLEEALAVLMGTPGASADAAMVRGRDDKEIVLDSLLPGRIERFPWAGHLGIKLVSDVADAIAKAGSTLVFTNTRSQSELWFRALNEARPEWLGLIAVHHGSIDRRLRQKIEDMLRAGALKAVVCTSSLDLGVDFWPVDQVIQIGSPKSIGRTMQRAGRSGHRPGVPSRILCVPTHAFELVEFSAARHGIAKRWIEPRIPILSPLDVLAQHLVTVAAGGGFIDREMFEEVKRTHAFGRMTEEQWGWVIDFVARGGPTLTAYPRFARVMQVDGRWTVADAKVARMHRMSIGTITSDGSVAVEFVSGKRLGTVEESFVGRMKPGDTFLFAGRYLELVRIHEMTAQVRAAKRKNTNVPRWMGGRLPLSGQLAEAVRLRLDQARQGDYVDAEMRAVAPILELQIRWSALPGSGQVLVESLKTREGHHHFIFPFQGRLVHEGLGALLAYRLMKRSQSPVTVTYTDYGIELLSPGPLPLDAAEWRQLLEPERLTEDLLDCVNVSELARRQFREIARIAGLLMPTHPGARPSVRQLQASSQLFFDVFREFDPDNLLLDQARREVLERQLEFRRLRDALQKLRDEQLVQTRPERLSPLAFPLWAERIQSQQLRSESASQRIERIAAQLEKAAMEEV
jgi:ATP-dependent helicase Lhr and Lhr-like helicase